MRIVRWATGTRPHPVTGDMLTPSDRLSWFAQNVIRRWSFLGLITLITAVVWINAHVWRADPLTQWNVWASYGALLIESIVGIGMFGQTMRDAKILRRIEAIEDAQREAAERDLAADLDTNALVHAIAAKLGVQADNAKEH